MPFFSAVIRQIISLKFEVIMQQVEVQINKIKINGLPGLMLITRVFWRTLRID